jgi:hypothetical protein
VRSVVTKVGTGTAFLRSHSVIPVNIIPPLFHILWWLDNGPVRGPVPQRHSQTEVARIKLQKIRSHKVVCDMRVSVPILAVLRSEHKLSRMVLTPLLPSEVS